MKATLSKSSTGNIRSKILDPKYHTAELIFEVQLKPSEFASLLERCDDRELELEVDNSKTK